jgi:hypothetical protein
MIIIIIIIIIIREILWHHHFTGSSHASQYKSPDPNLGLYHIANSQRPPCGEVACIHSEKDISRAACCCLDMSLGTELGKSLERLLTPLARFLHAQALSQVGLGLNRSAGRSSCGHPWCEVAFLISPARQSQWREIGPVPDQSL